MKGYYWFTINILIIINFLFSFIAHETGLVTLQVACEGFVISNSVFFEYRQRQSATNIKSEDWFSVEGKNAYFF